jgi:hypothetical protein
MTGRWIKKIAPKPAARDPLQDIRWIAQLAEPYLRGYAPRAAEEASLAGYWFDAGPAAAKAGPRRGKGKESNEAAADCGFFAGFLKDVRRFPCLNAHVPACLVFVWFREPGGELHRRLVTAPESLLRKTYEYIGWLTHRPPRFALFENEFVTMVRQQPLHEWPRDKYAHYARNFFIETFAWLVRSGLVKKLSDAVELGHGEPETR